MKKLGITIFLVAIFIFTAFHQSEAKRKNNYRTFEIIGITENGLTLQDNDGNIIDVNKEPKDYKVGYKVRYDSIRKRLRAYRWQDYEVSAISGDSISLHHKTGDTLSVKGNYTGKYKIGDQVRYNSLDHKLQSDENSGQWKQYTVVDASGNEIIIQSNDGQQVTLHMDNNLYPEQRGVYMGRYKVGDLVRYNASKGKLKKGVLRTYDWQDYTIKEVTEDQLVLINTNKKELTLENTYSSQFKTGDSVKYDRLNDLLKKVR